MSSDEEKIRKMEALVSLIDEPDPEVFRDISMNIHHFGTAILPFLEHAWENHHQPDVQKRIETIIHQIQYDQTCRELSAWIEGGGKDLLSACMIVARYAYPHLQEEDIEYELGNIRKEVWLELNDNLTALEQIKVFNYVFYELQGFHGNLTHYHAPENSYINKVLETKTGNPLSLGIVYLLIAQSLDLPIHGINLPDHFVLAYTGTSLNPDTLEFATNNVLFYINAFSKGSVFAVKDLEEFLKQLKHEPRQAYFQPCSNIDIIFRMLNNLVHAYDKESDTVKTREVQHLLTLFKKPGN